MGWVPGSAGCHTWQSKHCDDNNNNNNNARICLKGCRDQSKIHIRNIIENDIKELDPRKAYKYLGIGESYDIQHKKEKGKLKKEYFRRLRLILGTELYTSTNHVSRVYNVGSCPVVTIYGTCNVYYYYYLIKISQFHDKAGNDALKIFLLMRNALYSEHKFLRPFGSPQYDWISHA